MAIDSSLIVAAARRWIGTPYVHQASVRCVGCDCLGLIRGLWRELMGEEPEAAPAYSEDWSEASGEETLYAAFKRHFGEIAIADAAPGDIVLFRMIARGPAKHCAVVAGAPGALKLIHSRQNNRVAEEDLTRAWRRKMAFAFRF